MICPNCGAPILDAAVVCRICQKPVDARLVEKEKQKIQQQKNYEHAHDRLHDMDADSHILSEHSFEKGNETKSIYFGKDNKVDLDEYDTKKELEKKVISSTMAAVRTVIIIVAVLIIISIVLLIQNVKRPNSLSRPNLNGISVKPVSINTSIEVPTMPNLDWSMFQTTAASEKVRVGDLFMMGQYYFSDNFSDEWEPIAWKVIEVKEDRVLLMSENIIEVMAYDEYGFGNFFSWEESSIRLFLNTEFLWKYFSEEEIFNILWESYEEGGYEDAFFLLDEAQIRKYFPTEAERIAYMTPYAYKKAYEKDVQEKSPMDYEWWVHLGKENTNSLVVGIDGSVDTIREVGDICGVRPAVWVDIKAFQ